MMMKGSEKTVCASEKLMPCFCRFRLAFFGFQVNRNANPIYTVATNGSCVNKGARFAAVMGAGSSIPLNLAM